MNYIALDKYKNAWIFRHKDLPVTDEDKLQIKPLTELRAEQIWREHISRGCSHTEHLTEDDWAAQDANWLGKDFWQSAWDSETNELPDTFSEYFADWEPEVTVYFCYQSDHIIETKWSVFTRNWKNFLFFDNGPLLIGKKRKQVAQFFEDGTYRLGVRS